MNTAELQNKLLAAARFHPPGGDAPYGFETRVMARIRALPKADDWTIWGLALWRAAAPYLAIMLVVSAWTYFSSDSNSDTLDMALENTVVAPLNNDGDVW